MLAVIGNRGGTDSGLSLGHVVVDSRGAVWGRVWESLESRVACVELRAPWGGWAHQRRSRWKAGSQSRTLLGTSKKSEGGVLDLVVL